MTATATSKAHRLTRSRAGHVSTCLAIAALGVPAAFYLWVVHRYSVNVYWADQWNDVSLAGHAFSGTLGFNTLWAQHNENRIFFPNLVVLALAYTTHLNVIVEEYLAALMLLGAGSAARSGDI